MINELSKRIWSQNKFHNEASELRRYLLQARYILEEKKEFDQKSLVRLLRSAAILSASSEKSHREMAYQIITSASELEYEKYPGVPYLLLLVLCRMGNFPALSYAKRRYSINEDSLPVELVAESFARREGNTVLLGNVDIALTDFQHALWNELNIQGTIGISAPTSAGKSFIFQAYAQKLLTEEKAKNIAFLVPTRALINQVSEDVVYWLSSSKLGIELITTPIAENIDVPERGVYVVTQERMQLLQTAHPKLSFDLMLIDEVQSIADGPRGVLLSSIIETALNRNNKMQLIFAGPNISCPGKLANIFGRDEHTIRTEEATVIQNIIFVDCDEANTKSTNLSVYTQGGKLGLGSVNCDQPLTDHVSKLVNIALTLGRNGQNLIYALGPSECENIAFGLSDKDLTIAPTQLKELSDFIKEAVHPKYQLAENVLQGVGFHYGRLPSLVRKAIEDSFSDGDLQFLVTTSTLLYGVNMPAQNLFLHKPQKGQNRPISPIDFWNLAGRAGRLGKEFSGNVFLIDYGDWASDPLNGEKDQIVKPSISDHVADRTQELIEYINDPARVPDRTKQDEFENTFVKLVKDQLEGKLEDTLEKSGLHKQDLNHPLLVQAIKNSINSTSLDLDTFLASPTVSIYRQQSLYDRLNESFKKKGASYIIPKHPQDSKAYNSYVAAIKRCHDEIMKFSKADKSHTYFAQIALKWMKGQPLPQIIDASLEYRLKTGKNPNIATVIRETLSEVEKDLRFKYVRLFSCYNAVLERVLRDNNKADLISSIPSIPMYLEMGACSPTMISFMGLGLSRYTAGKLNTLSRRKDMAQNDARNWILRQKLDALDIPNASVKEINRMIFENS